MEIYLTTYIRISELFTNVLYIINIANISAVKTLKVDTAFPVA
jgi:hypothetical protein